MDDSTRRNASPGEGSVYPFRNGYRGTIQFTDRTGTRQRRTVSGKTEREARRALDKVIEQLGQGLTPPKNVKTADFLAEWLEASRQRIRPATWRQYESVTRVYIRPALGAVDLVKLTPSDVERMTGGLIASGRSPRTAAVARVVLRRALADAVRDGLAHRNVAALARPPHVPARALRSGVDYLDPADLRRLVTGAKVHPLGPLVTVAATTGLRQGEVLGLTWADVDLDEATLTVRRSLARSWDGWCLSEPKTARSRRTINLPSAAVAALTRQRDLQEAAKETAGRTWQDRDGLVFTDSVGKPLRGDDVTHAWGRLLDSVGLPRIPFHGLRHSAATAMLAAGVPLKVVSDTLGHSTITVTADRYAGVVPAQRRDAADAMDRVMGGA